MLPEGTLEGRLAVIIGGQSSVEASRSLPKAYTPAYRAA
jgi:hypothetical protein